MTSARWLLRTSVDSAAARALAMEAGCAQFLAELLCARGITSGADAQSFLFPRLKSLSDPFLLPQMRAAVERILAAIDRKERIVIYGDYDVDGVTSIALFTRVLRAFGAEPAAFLPHRMDEGYGLSPDGVNRCVSVHAPQLLIAVDCGTCSNAEIASLRDRNIDVIVFDHHECKGDPPDACALVNPKLGDDFHYLCSAGIVFKACHALLKERPLTGFDLRDYLDLVALGTVADIVPLRGENRALVHRGLQQFEKTRWPGLRALMQAAGVKPPLSAPDIGFKLGPRINAAGRLASAEEALELLLTDDATRAQELAADLSAQNRERQNIEQETLKQAEEKLAREFDPARDAAIVIGNDGWHPGVLGIVASRLSKAHHRPALVTGFDAEGAGKGSGRSIEGLSLVKALTCCAGYLEKFGGHEMAAGLAVRREHFAGFQEAFRRCAREMLTDEQLQPRLYLDAEVRLDEIGFDFLRQHDQLQPFGIDNIRPVFLARNVTVNDVRVLKEKHLRFTARQKGSRSCAAIFFDGATGVLPKAPWDIAFQVARNEYNGSISVQLEIKAVRAAES